MADERHWLRDAACAAPEHDPRWWDIDNPADWRRAAAICSACPVRAACIVDAWENPLASGLYAGVVLKSGRRAATQLP
jgi:hypothetical protein